MSLELHTRDHHEKFSCEACERTFEVFDQLQEHFSYEHSSLSTSCQSCGALFDDTDSLQIHMEEAHEELILAHTMASQVNAVYEHRRS